MDGLTAVPTLGNLCNSLIDCVRCHVHGDTIDQVGHGT